MPPRKLVAVDGRFYELEDETPFIIICPKCNSRHVHMGYDLPANLSTAGYTCIPENSDDEFHRFRIEGNYKPADGKWYNEVCRY